MIELDLPKIYADISFRGQLLEGTLFVSALTVNRFKTLETPFDWAGTQPEEYELTGENVSAHLNPVLKITTLSKAPPVGAFPISNGLAWSTCFHQETNVLPASERAAW
ncbi:hypothetical protein [Paraburkholderia caribensis]|uniref:hypothetical protein n=1 Tax=Paraburkholderia caribensis TaxID=75105 RepID=UPI0031E0FD59